MNIKLLKKCIIILIIVIILILAILLVLINIEKNKKPDSIFKQSDETYYEEIQYKKYNEVTYAYINDQQICNIYLMDYKSNMIYNKEEAYKKLDKEYREKRFGSLEKFKNYIEKNEEKIYGIKLAKYEVKSDKNGKRYICIDQYGNYYIFNETAIMQYSVILDTFTIDLPEYIEKYNKSKGSQKVAFCIDKFIKNINVENYTLAYGMLSQGFKNNYFKNQASFENYAKQNFLGKDQITFEEVQNEAEVYIYKVILTSSQNNENKIEKSFNVKLGVGTQFEISFNMQ